MSDFNTGIAQAEANFNTKFQTVFGDNYKDLEPTMPNVLQFSKQALANLFGGMGYFYGPIRIMD